MKKWLHLIGYGTLIFSSQILWVTFSPITTDVAEIMGTSVGKIGTLAALFPIVYIIIAFPAGRLLDSHFKLALGFGALTVGLGAIARLFFPFSYNGQFAIQIMLSIGQPFIVNSFIVYASRYFPEKNRSLAISLASVSLFLGVIFAMVLSPLIFSSGGLMQVYIIFAIPSVLSMVWVLYTLFTKKMNQASLPETGTSIKLSHLFEDKVLWILSGLLAIGIGIFDVLSTWIEPLFAEYGIPGSISGPLLAVMLVSGIISSTFLPSLVAKKDTRRTYMTITLIVTASAFIAIAIWQWIPWIILWLIASGFMLLAGLPVIMDWTEKHFDVHQHGTALGILMLISHAGGVIMIYLVKFFLNSASLALTLLAFVTLSGLLLTRLLPKRENTEDKEIS